MTNRIPRRFYKFLDSRNRAPWSGVRYPMPKYGKPGAELPAVEDELSMCNNGYHACTKKFFPRYCAYVFSLLRTGYVVMIEHLCTTETGAFGKNILRERELDHEDLIMEKWCLRGPVRVVKVVGRWTDTKFQRYYREAGKARSASERSKIFWKILESER